MKKIIPFFLFSLLTVGLFVMCNERSNYMVLDDIHYVDTFPQIFSLDNSVEIDLESLDILGVNDLCVFDSLMIVSTQDKNGYWSFVSLPDFLFLGKFITQGQGPFEFFQNPFSGGGDIKYFNENGEIFVTIYHFDKGKLYKMNISESLKNNQLSISTIHDSLPYQLFDFVAIDSITFFCKEISNRATQQIRYLLVDGKRITYPHLEKLNLAKIKEREDYNILATSTKYDFKSNRIVEMPGHLNYLNIYSIDGSFGKTICIGNRLDDIGKIQEKDRWTERMDTFTDLRLFSRFWGVVYINRLSSAKVRDQPSKILLFDWNGEPLAQINLNNYASAFDIDLKNGYLYTLDRRTDLLYKFDVRDILKEIHVD